MNEPLDWDTAAARLREAHAPATDGRPVGDLQAFLEDLRARGFAPRAILDVGGFTGCWSRTAKEVFPEADCFLVEPQAEMRADLEAFCEEFPGSRWFPVAAGAAPGELELTVWPEDFSGSTLLWPADPEGQAEGMETRTVPVVTLDALIAEGALPVPQLAKLDVQGFELEVLRGAESLFGGTEVFILELTLLESVNPGWPIVHEVVAFMAERGYHLYDIPGFLRRPSDGALGQIDACFVKADSALRTDGTW